MESSESDDDHTSGMSSESSEDGESMSGLDSSSESDSDSRLHDGDNQPSDLLELYFVLYNTRYLVHRHITPKSDEFASQFFHNLPDKLFRQLTRMSKASFFNLVELIASDPVFQNNSFVEQAPVVRQLAVCLDRLGHHGNGACLNHMIPTWGVSNGSLVNFSNRCFKALESVLFECIKWPSRQERQVLSEKFAQHGFPGCVGLIDGSLLPLAQRPCAHGECYYDRNSRYSVNVQVVCDHKGRILFMFSGMPGSCSDLTCLRRSPLWQYCTDIQSNLTFDDGQYILGDSGYQALPHMVCAFKRADMVPDKEDFNTCVAKCRVTNEHCIGVLKSRWHSLKEVRTQLNAQKDHTWLIRWVLLCGRLHNYVMDQNDLWTEEDDEEGFQEVSSTEEGGVGPLPGRVSRRSVVLAGNALLVQVMDKALAFNRCPGRFLWSAHTV